MMSNRFFILSLILIGIISLFGCIAFSFFGIFLVMNKQLTNEWIEKQAKELGLKVGYVELKGNGK